MPSRPSAPRIVQITDLHLFEHEHGQLDWHDDCREINTDRTLARVLDRIRAQEAHVDAIIVTGDIAQEPTVQTYRRFAWIMASTGLPVFCLPGNHDDVPVMLAALATGEVSIAKHVILGGWLLLFLNSVDPGLPAGRIPETEMERAASLLRQYPDLPALLFLHHQPIAIGSAWIDRIGLANRQELFARLAAFPQVQGAVFGHVHQAVDVVHGRLRMLGTPSTCVQFVSNRPDHAYDTFPPAYRSIDLYPDGTLGTEVVYVATDALDFPRSSRTGSVQLSPSGDQLPATVVLAASAPSES
ncbi:MAG: metallophosphoesterase [Thiotrichales bacterium]